MKKALLGMAFMAATIQAAYAGCVGSGSFQTCTDASGNSYSVSRYGNTTNVQGYNANTGSSWNQQSSTIGNTTYHNGTAANGNSWNGSSMSIGGTTYHNGTNSQGQSYSKTCNAYGCF